MTLDTPFQDLDELGINDLGLVDDTFIFVQKRSDFVLFDELRV